MNEMFSQVYTNQFNSESLQLNLRSINLYTFVLQSSKINTMYMVVRKIKFERRNTTALEYFPICTNLVERYAAG